MRYKEQGELHKTETCAKSRPRESGAKSLGVVKAKFNNMGQKYNTDTLLATLRREMLAIVSGRQAAEGHQVVVGGKGRTRRSEEEPGLPYLVITSLRGPNLTAHYILSLYLLLIHTRYKETRYEGWGRTNLPDTNHSPREQPKKKNSAKVSSRFRFPLLEADKLHGDISDLCSNLEPLQ